MRHITALQSKRLQSIACSDMEDIRLDEEAVLKTAGANHASGFESLVFRFE